MFHGRHRISIVPRARTNLRGNTARTYAARKTKNKSAYEALPKDKLVQLEKSLNIQSLEDWYKQSKRSLPPALASKGLYKFLTTNYPEHDWLPWKFQSPPKGWLEDAGHLRKLILHIAKESNLGDSFEDFYKITYKHFVKYKAISILQKYVSIAQVLQTAFPEHKWLPWKFDITTRRFWSDRKNQLEFMEWLKEQMNLKTMEDLYKIKMSDITKHARGLCNQYRDTLLLLMQTIYPDHKFLPWKFTHAPKRWWQDRANVRWYMDWLRGQLGWSRLEDCYQITANILVKNYGHGILIAVGGSPNEVVRQAYPEHEWLPWKFRVTPKHWWSSKENQLQYFEWLKKQMNWKTMDDLYHVSRKVFIDNDGMQLLIMNRNSPSQVVQKLYPDHKWLPWKFPGIPRNWWRKKSNQKQYIEWLAEKSGWKSLNDYYNLSQELLFENNGSSLLNYYNSSPLNILKALYPSHTWLPWKLTRVPLRYWDSVENQRKFIEQLRQSLNMKSMDSLYKLTGTTIREAGGIAVLKKYNNHVPTLLQALYPEHPWDATKFVGTHLSVNDEHKAVAAFREMFPRLKAHHRYRASVNNSSKLMSRLELDIYFEGASLAVEVQGDRHFYDIVAFGEVHKQATVDALKAVVCGLQNITLVEVPYWWDESTETLRATVASLRPDLYNTQL